MVYTGYETNGYTADNDSDTWKSNRFERSRNKVESTPNESKDSSSSHKTRKAEPIHADNANKVFDKMIIDPTFTKHHIGINDPENIPKPQRQRVEYASYDKNHPEILEFDPTRGSKVGKAPKSPRNERKIYQ